MFVKAGLNPLDLAVALLAEGVDRNIVNRGQCFMVQGRPPRGGRG